MKIKNKNLRKLKNKIHVKEKKLHQNNKKNI